MSEFDDLTEAIKENTAVLKELLKASDYFYNNAYASVYNAMLAAHQRFVAEKKLEQEQYNLHRMMAEREQRRFESFLRVYEKGVGENDNH